MKGRLIVIDGGDGAGKATQVSLLVDRLRVEGFAVETLDFPQYQTNTFGKLLRECLDGKRGDFLQLDPCIASTLYAADRFESKPLLEQWLAEGKMVVLDRYVSSNMLHQGAKVADSERLESFLGWLDTVEYSIFGMPRPDLIVYLEVPFVVRMQLKVQAIRDGKHGATIEDMAEQSREHQAAVEKYAQEIVAARNNWQVVACVERGEIKSREHIHEAVYKLVQSVL